MQVGLVTTYLLFITMKRKKYIISILLVSLSFNCAVAQNKCLDTLGGTKLYSPDFETLEPYFSRPLVDSDSSTIYCKDNYIFKKNKNNTFAWKKKIDKLININFIQNDNGIIGNFNFYNTVTNSSDWGLAKVNSTGNLLWAKKTNINDSFQNAGFFKGNNNEIVAINYKVNEFGITIIDSNANIMRLGKSYKSITNFWTGVWNNSPINTLIDSSYIYIALMTTTMQRPPIIYTHYLNLFKISYNTGEIVKTAKYNFNDIYTELPYFGNPGYTSKGGIGSVNIKQAGSFIYLNGSKAVGVFGSNGFCTIKMDTNLNIINNKMYKYSSGFGFNHSNSFPTIASMDDKGNAFFAHMNYPNNFGDSDTCYYFFTDSGLNITSQRVQRLAQIGIPLTGNGHQLVNPFLQNEGKASLSFYSYTSYNSRNIHILNFLKDASPSNCTGFKDTSLTAETLTYNTLPPPNFVVSNANNILLTPYNLTSIDMPVQVTKFCGQSSICDSLKIIGATNFCLSSPNASFSYYKNPQCLRKVNWLIDTTIIKIMSVPNETTINVKFLQPYHGFIKAAIDGCVVKDSLYIGVNNPMQAPNLGADTTHCPGKTIPLNAGLGFKTYKWQNNSTNSTYLVTEPGVYFVSATDSCNNIFYDTIVVKPIDVNFNMQILNPICLYDTAIVTLNSKMYNFLWSPSNTAYKQNNTLKFFPDNTTLYTVTADRFVGCTLSDTVNVKVLKCPIYFYVPTAFTPNSDNVNDLFRPTVSGKIEKYQFTVYNRFGQIVFNSTKLNEGWSGKFNGVLQDIGTYTWICSYKFKNEELVFKKGSVLLLK